MPAEMGLVARLSYRSAVTVMYYSCTKHFALSRNLTVLAMCYNGGWHFPISDLEVVEVRLVLCVGAPRPVGSAGVFR